MLPPRRFLPSLSLLAAFEAVSRLGSITAAAKELGLTQSAVSRQILALEEQLSVGLFIRERQTIKLSLAGDGYAREIREALRRISTASLNLRANPEGGSLNIAILPSFGSRWLVPRLAGFLNANPSISVNLLTRTSPFDFRLDSVDAAIHFGAPLWAGAELSYLMKERIIVASSPDFQSKQPSVTPSDLLSLPLLHLTTRPDAWEKWFFAHDVAFDNVHGMLFDQFNTVGEAAIAGLGCALLPSLLFETEFEQGRLVELITSNYASDDAYYLAYTNERSTYPPLVAFKEWLELEASLGKTRT